MKRIVVLAALVAMFVVGVVPQAFAQGAAGKVADLQAKVDSSLTDETAIYNALSTELGTDAGAVSALQTECGVPVTGAVGANTDGCLRTIAGAIARARAAAAAGQRVVEDELAGARAALKLKLGVGPLAKPTFTPSAEVMKYALTVCAPGTQVRWLTPKKFTCTDPVFAVMTPKAEDCTVNPDGSRSCTLTIAALGAKYGREGVVPLPEPISFPEPEKPKGWCGGSTFCRVAVITTTVVVVGMGVAYGVHMIKEGTASPVTVLR